MASRRCAEAAGGRGSSPLATIPGSGAGVPVADEGSGLWQRSTLNFLFLVHRPVTYCIGYWLEKGLVLASDSRTNAGVDYISSYSKMHVFQPASDRLFILLAAGNLATTQAVINLIRRDLDRAVEASDEVAKDLRSCDYLFEAAAYVGRVSVAAQQENAPALQQAGASAGASFILGGQIAGESHGLYLIYPQGNAIMATRETPYLQIGESKYGKPPLDNVGHTNLSLEDAARLCLISEVLTQRSNLTVGPPFELAIVPRNTMAISHRVKFEAEAPELAAMIEIWSDAQREALYRLPHFTWEHAHPG
jgi:putative proteasome-type protease